MNQTFARIRELEQELADVKAQRDELAAMYLHARLAPRQIDLPVDARRILDEHRHELYQDASQPVEPTR